MDAELPRVEGGGDVTARERMREAEASCDHVDEGICRDCCARAIRIHAEAVREEAARTCHQVFQDLKRAGAFPTDLAAALKCEQRIRAIEVS